MIPSRGRGFSIKGRVWESIVKVVVQNNVAILRNPRVGKRLPRTGVQILKGWVGKLSASDNLKRADSRLRAFIYVYGHGQLIFRATIVVFYAGVNFHFCE